MGYVLRWYSGAQQCPITAPLSPVPDSERAGDFLAAAANLAAPCAVQVEGRNGAEWLKSIQAYLLWRAGVAWRPISRRFDEERQHYLECYRGVYDAQSGRTPLADLMARRARR